ncbi:MAG: MepB family protein [Chlamydiales bacterium]|nr:MepB family protein [Chlamydiales bacterium]
MSSSRNQTLLDVAHPDFLLAQQLAYDPNGLEATNIRIEKESADYGALDFQLNGKTCKFRVGKITPKKVGFFFTIWKRLGNGPIQPYDMRDPVDFFIFSVRNEKQFGQFFFPKTTFVEKGIISNSIREGKRAIRVYPPWVITDSRQARNTQLWQKDYFLEISKDRPVDASRVQKLLHKSS